MTWGTGRRRAGRGGTWSCRALGALVVGLAAWAAPWSPASVGAAPCTFDLLVPCTDEGAPEAPPAAPPSTTVPSPTTTTTVRQLTPAEAAARLLDLLNVERQRAGLGLFSTRADVAGIASAWTASMAGADHLSHNDAYFTKDTRRRLDARALGENVARNADVDAAHRALMASAPHRANILDARFSVVGVGAELRNGSWWVTEDFLQPVTVAAASGPSAATPAPGVEAAGSVAAATPAATGDEAPAASGADAVLTIAPPSAPALAVLEPQQQHATTDDRPTVLASASALDRRVGLGLLGAGLVGLALAYGLRRALRATQLRRPTADDATGGLAATA